MLDGTIACIGVDCNVGVPVEWTDPITKMFFCAMVKSLGRFLPDEIARGGSKGSESTSTLPFDLAQRCAQKSNVI